MTQVKNFTGNVDLVDFWEKGFKEQFEAELAPAGEKVITLGVVGTLRIENPQELLGNVPAPRTRGSA